MAAIVMCFKLKRPLDDAFTNAVRQWLHNAEKVPGFGRFSFVASDAEAVATLVADDISVVDHINAAMGTTTWVADNLGPYLASEPHVINATTIADSNSR